GAERLDLAVAEEVRDGGEIFGRLQRRGVIRLEVVAVGAVKDINVPERGMIALLDDLERLAVARRDEGAAGLAFVEELVLRHLRGFGMMRDEDDLHVLIFGADEAIEKEKKALG